MPKNLGFVDDYLSYKSELKSSKYNASLGDFEPEYQQNIAMS
ncbi:MAG: hypothetical protein VST69_03080 [Nitrospirota bacterium]|nr:hypothetical protein [Nitrospirota bacterium]